MNQVNASWPMASGEMADRIRQFDWAATPLGHIDRWVPALRNSVELLLAHGFPMILLWGPDLIQIYNDGYRQILGNRHPQGLGQPTFVCWPETVEAARPILERVQVGETVTLEDAPFSVSRNDVLETAWFTATFSPVRSGTIVSGVLIIAFENTARIRADAEQHAVLAEQRENEERQAFLLKFSDALRTEPNADAVANRALEMLLQHLKLDRCYVTYYVSIRPAPQARAAA